MKTVFYLIRHGKHDSSEVESHGFWGIGLEMAPLNEIGIEQPHILHKRFL